MATRNPLLATKLVAWRVNVEAAQLRRLRLVAAAILAKEPGVSRTDEAVDAVARALLADPAELERVAQSLTVAERRTISAELTIGPPADPVDADRRRIAATRRQHPDAKDPELARMLAMSESTLRRREGRKR